MSKAQLGIDEKQMSGRKYGNYLKRLDEIEKENVLYQAKIMNLLKNNSSQDSVQEEGGSLDSSDRQSGIKLAQSFNKENKLSNESEDLVGLSSFYHNYMTVTNRKPQHLKQRTLPNQKPPNLKQRTAPVEQELCNILKIIKNNNKKTSIQLIIQILHQITHPNSSNPPQSFSNYHIRFKHYKNQVQNNYNPTSKLEHSHSQLKQQHNQYQHHPSSHQTQPSLLNHAPSFERTDENYIEFSAPYNVVEYFKFKNSLAEKRYLDREPFSERRFLYKDFCIKGHTYTEYDCERKTAKVFCLVGPGVRAARPFMGQDLGSHSHSKTISNIVMNAYRALEQYINDNLHAYLKPQDMKHDLLNPPFKADGVEYPGYYASRRELSGIKTPLFNCRNWMDQNEVELFLMFVKKCYRIKYVKEWEEEKVDEIFLLFGRIIKKLVEKDILMRNLKFLRGEDFFGVETGQQRKQILEYERKRKGERDQKWSMDYGKGKEGRREQKRCEESEGKLGSSSEIFGEKYYKEAGSFRLDK